MDKDKEIERLKQITKDKQKRIRYWQREAVSIIHKFGDMERRALIAEDENSRLKEALQQAHEALRWYADEANYAKQCYYGDSPDEAHEIASPIDADFGERALEILTQYATPEPTGEAQDG